MGLEPARRGNRHLRVRGSMRAAPARPRAGIARLGRETTTAPASVQEYSGSQQVTVVPTISTERNLLGNANGTVTADWSADGLASGKGAYKVNDRVVVALNTATPLYRDLKTGDKGDDVLALNNELSRLGYNSVAGSDTYWWATSDGWRQLMNDNGNPPTARLRLPTPCGFLKTQSRSTSGRPPPVPW